MTNRGQYSLSEQEKEYIKSVLSEEKSKKQLLAELNLKPSQFNNFLTLCSRNKILVYEDKNRFGLLKL